MTEDEKRQQKALLLLEFQEAETNLANLREKAGRIGREVSEVGEWLARMSPEYAPNMEYNKADHVKRSATILTSLAKYRSAMNFDEAITLMGEIDQTVKSVAALALRKSELGLK